MRPPALMPPSQQAAGRGCRLFWALWALLLGLRLALAPVLPLFIDEAFYAWEARHPAWAYSDLPGLTAWSIAFGLWLLGPDEFAIRLVSVALGAMLPLQMLRVADAAGLRALRYRVGLLALALPLLGFNGLLALPEPALLLAAALCLGGLLRLLAHAPGSRAADVRAGLLELAAGLCLGAFSHYRFALVVGAGALALLWVPAARAWLRDPRLWWVALAGALAWLPLVLFNFVGEQAGWRFQFVERHPWSFQPQALGMPLEQALVATPLAWALMLLALPAALRERRQSPGLALLAAAGLALLAALFLLGLFADRERVSFHWPLVGQLALLPLLAQRLQAAGQWLRRLTWSGLVLGSVLAWLALLGLALPSTRPALAEAMASARSFSPGRPLAEAVRAELASLPPGTRVVAEHFEVGARLVQAGLDAPIGVLDHPLNPRHGRALQLRLWRLDESAWRPQEDPSRLLVLDPQALPLRQWPDWNRGLCARLPGLRGLGEVVVDGGVRRYLLYLQQPGAEGCQLPPVAYLDQPRPGARLPRSFELSGWAFEDGAGVAAVEVLLEGRAVSQAVYGLDYPGVRAQWPGSTDPNHPAVGLRAFVEVPEGLVGRLPLGLRLRLNDGRTVDLDLGPVRIEDAGGRSQ